MGQLRPPPPSKLAGYRPFQQHVLCMDELEQLQGGQQPRMCREEAAMPDFRKRP